MNPLLESFLQEARENLAFIDQHIEDLSSGDAELVNAVFRAAHTLKGGSGIVGFTAVKDITHHAEDLLDMVRSGDIDASPAVIESLYNAFDEVMNLIEAAEESEDIVEADEATVQEIVQTLCDQMGKSTEKEAWKLPFNLLKDPSSIVNLPLDFLRNSQISLPLHAEEITEESLNEKRLYAVRFDVDESCMLYGNDPAYALSLLGDKVKYVYSCMNEDSAKSILSGLDDEEGLTLRMQLIAFVDAEYTQIEEALFNFIDELLFLPLDITTLLGVSRGEVHPLDVMKELSINAKKELSSKESLRRVIEDSLDHIGEETLQYAQLQRFLDVLGSTDELEALTSFFDVLYLGRVYTGKEEVQEKILQAEALPVKKVELTENLLAGGKMIIEQQLLQLRDSDDQALFERVKAVVEKTARLFSVTMGEISSKAELADFAASLIGEKEEAPSESRATESVKKAEEVLEKEASLMFETAVQTETKSETPAAAVVPEKAAAPEKTETKRGVVGKTVKIEQESVDSLMNVIGELLVAKNSLPYLADSVHKMTAEETKRAIMGKYTFINRLSEQLQDLIMSMRMLPISYVFDRYPKLVRDISKKLNKKVNLTMEGGETKLDKNIIEMMADPMIHIMRNSLDHGIELPEVRESRGKSPEGNVKLKAYSQSDKIIIEIKDDGAGINIERVVQKVVDKGLLSMEQIDAMDENAQAELVLLAGLSTADEITEFSGRGVGMDVVKKSIEGFGGSISISTKKGVGTTITLAIPVSLAVTTLLHVEMNSVHYGFPMDSVQETVKIEKSEIQALHNEPFIYLRGEVIPLLFINSMLNLEEIKNKQLSIIVLNIKGNALAVVVNQLLGQLDVVQKPLSGMIEGHPVFSGTALLGNGQIIMMIDPVGLLGICDQLQTPLRNIL
ncbi:MAG: chemotaxis protein CheA [Campylobacterales bacterium]|nr:chemotaxis protein CheA [Campylobacterales bacterium]MBE0499523.1 chemotaxis protein CheA [Campylobacterales bacterium]